MTTNRDNMKNTLPQYKIPYAMAKKNVNNVDQKKVDQKKADNAKTSNKVSSPKNRSSNVDVINLDDIHFFVDTCPLCWVATDFRTGFIAADSKNEICEDCAYASREFQ